VVLSDWHYALVKVKTSRIASAVSGGASRQAIGTCGGSQAGQSARDAHPDSKSAQAMNIEPSVTRRRAT